MIRILVLTTIFLAKLDANFGEDVPKRSQTEDQTEQSYYQLNPLQNSYHYGYEVGPDGHFHHERRGQDGVTYGCYGYVDPGGKLHVTHYVADSRGYRVVEPSKPVLIYLEAERDWDDYGSEESAGTVRPWTALFLPRGCGRYGMDGSGEPPELVFRPPGVVSTTVRPVTSTTRRSTTTYRTSSRPSWTTRVPGSTPVVLTPDPPVQTSTTRRPFSTLSTTRYPTTTRYPSTTTRRSTTRYPETSTEYPMTAYPVYPVTTSRKPSTSYPVSTTVRPSLSSTTRRTTTTYRTSSTWRPEITRPSSTTSPTYPTTTRRPITSTRYPTTTSGYPTSTSKRPSSTTRIPTSTTGYPVTCTDHPMTSYPIYPGMTTKYPVSTTVRPSSTTRRTTTTYRTSTSTTRKPQTTRPSSTTPVILTPDPPVFSTTRPSRPPTQSSTTRRPTTSTGYPPSTTKRPSSTTRTPASTTRYPVTTTSTTTRKPPHTTSQTMKPPVFVTTSTIPPRPSSTTRTTTRRPVTTSSPLPPTTTEDPSGLHLNLTIPQPTNRPGSTPTKPTPAPPPKPPRCPSPPVYYFIPYHHPAPHGVPSFPCGNCTFNRGYLGLAPIIYIPNERAHQYGLAPIRRNAIININTKPTTTRKPPVTGTTTVKPNQQCPSPKVYYYVPYPYKAPEGVPMVPCNGCKANRGYLGLAPVIYVPSELAPLLGLDSDGRGLVGGKWTVERFMKEWGN